MGREIATVGVVGLGTMGAGITEVMARTGLRVLACEIDDAALNRGRAHVAHSTRRAVSRGKLSAEEAAALIDRIEYTTDLSIFAEADFVVEAIPERLELKRDLFRKLDGICSEDTIFATNTSSLSVTEISVATSRPARVVGMHFFNPAPVMKLVEIVRTVVTDPEVLVDVETLAARLGKSPVTIGDKAGFIANALLFGYLNHAAAMFEAKYATREDIDDAMRLGCGLPMGPLALLDLIGLDTAYEILDTMYKQSRDRLHAPAPIFKQMKTAGLLGRKSGRGFYTYAQRDVPTLVPDALTPTPGAETEGARAVSRVGVVGSGTMANGIAEVFVKAGYATVQVARTDEKVTAARAAIAKSLSRAVEKGKLTAEELDTALANLVSTTRMADVADCDLVVEAVVEDLDVKLNLFKELDGIVKPGAVLATTTSSLPVIECAMATSRPRDVVGIHFFNPAPVMKLVEVVRTVATADDVLATAHAVVQKLGKHGVNCGDRAGFIVNALLFPYLNDAVKMLQAHYATADGIDTAMKLGCGYPMGPFELLDVVGLDVSLAIERMLYLEFREPGFAPAPLLEHLVTAGYLGRKTGKGFRDYVR
ncbi:MAG TPA: 3-hydroxybutyryl-CoA dehydrogenase [Thermoleophilia bacterium]|nr:3-hydroxybutyryl-CoA dehydrogenase [Thermoleophilia bacterium]